MVILLGHSSEGIDIVLTDEHPACIQYCIPCVAVGRGPGAPPLGKRDQVKTINGLFNAARLVVDWLEAGPVRSEEGRGLGFRFLKDCPEFL